MMRVTSHPRHEWRGDQHASQVIVCDGTPEAEERITRVLTNDPMLGIFRHADAGYDLARQCADELTVKIPMQ